MSQITREINKITGTIISISGKLIVYAVVVLLLVEGISKGYAFGHDIFYAKAVSAAPGKDITVAIGERDSVSEVAGDLHKLGLIENQYAFIIQRQFYDYDIHPGTYILNTAMTSKEMLALLSEKPEAEETEETQAPLTNEIEETIEGMSLEANEVTEDEGADESDRVIEVEP